MASQGTTTPKQGPEIVVSESLKNGFKNHATRVAKEETNLPQSNDDDDSYDAQRAHFDQTVSALRTITEHALVAPPLTKIAHLLVTLPPFDQPFKTKTIVFDLDETLIHCVDDYESDNPQVVIPIKFSEDPEPVMAGINIRPHLTDCLEFAVKHF
jgi:hypothetical protein